MSKVIVKLQTLPHFKGLELPDYATIGSAGLDVRAAIDANTQIVLKPNERKLIATGLKMEIPLNYEIQVRPRSGLAFKHGVTIANAPGTIDSDYRGEIGVLLINLGQEDFIVKRGERVAQLILAPVVQAQFSVVESLSETARGTGGYGSTGEN